MKRHPALQDLSRDHHHGLVMARELRRAAEGAEDGDPVEEVTQRFLTFWEDELAAHFTEEEHVLLPVYRRRVDLLEDAQVRRMLEDHAWFRDTVPELANRLAAGEPQTDLVREIGERLDAHARFEDRELFASMEDAFTEEDLDDVAERSERFRRTHRGEAAIGPRTSREDL